jgi:hypothetical protein
MSMSEFRIEAVGEGQDESVTLPKASIVFEILERLWTICSDEKFGRSFDRKPEGEFLFREREWYDRIFRVRTFEGREEADRERREPDGGPGHNGFDLLGKYSLGDSMITVYVDSCRRAVSEYSDGIWKLENLIKVVLIHELAHLITHIGFDLKGDETNHVWEYTAQCATYAYLKIYGEPEDLKAFQQLSPHQPFIYRTWESLKAVESVQSKNLVAAVVKSVFSALKEPPPPGFEDQHFTSGYGK